MENKKRFIDANKLKNLVCHRCNEDYSDDPCEPCDRSFVYAIDKAPTEDVIEVVHGRWVDNMVRDWQCSECGKKVPKQVRFDGYCYNDKLNYCPNCGAKMDG